MSLLRLLVLLLLMMPFLSYAEDEEQKPGSFSVAVSASGFFRPKLTEVEVIEVSKNSPAEKAGMVAGQKIRSINGCQIPGCPVTEMEKLMGKISTNRCHWWLKPKKANKPLSKYHCNKLKLQT